VAAEEHVGIIERAIRTNKDDTRCHIHRLPHTHYPKAMVEGSQRHSIHRRNNLPAKNGVSQVLSPETLISGMPAPDYNEIVKLNFGDYVQTYEGDMNSSNKSRYIRAIALYPSPSGHGSWYFMSLLSGKRIHRNSWVKLPATEDVIQRVNELAKEQNQKPVDSNFKYAWTCDDISDENDEEDENEENVSNMETENIEVLDTENEQTVMEVEEVEIVAPVDVNQPAEQDDGDDARSESRENEILNPLLNEGSPIENEREEETVEDNGRDNENEGAHQPDEAEQPDTVEEATDTQESVQNQGSNMVLRQRNRIDYATLHNRGTSHMQVKGAKQFQKKIKRICKELKRKHHIIIKDMFRKVVAVTMAQIKSASKHEQVSMREGIRRYGELAIKAVLKEYAQLDNKRIFKPTKASSLTNLQKRNALNLITLIKFKRNGTVKGRACADGRKQRLYISKDEATSPAVQLESILMSLMIDAVDKRDVATCDIVGAYLFATMDEFILIRLTGESVDIMCDTNPDYRDYVIISTIGKGLIWMYAFSIIMV